MPGTVDFDAERIRLILRDLERTTGVLRDLPSTIRLERAPEAEPGIIIRGIATRPAMIRLGLRIINDALEAESITLIDNLEIIADPVTRSCDARVIEITLSDEALLKPQPIDKQKPPPRIWEIGCFLLMVAMLVTFLVGMVTIGAVLVQ